MLKQLTNLDEKNAKKTLLAAAIAAKNILMVAVATLKLFRMMDP
jgi:hypothetical protein